MDLVDLAGTESLAVLALKAVQAVPHPVPGGEGTSVPRVRVVTMTGHGSAGVMTVQHVRRGRAVTMIVPLVRVAMMTVRGSVAMTIVPRVRVETTTAPRGRAVTMTDLFVRVGTMTGHGSAGVMTVQHVRRGRAATVIVPRVHVVMMTDHDSAAMRTAQRVRVETMVDRVVPVEKTRVPVFVVTMIDVLVRAVTILVRVDPELQRNSARMKSATRVAVAA